MFFSLRPLGYLFVFTGAICGCSRNGRMAIEGTVTYDGQPLPLGSIAFLPGDEKGVKVGGRIENGHFKIDAQFGPNPGPHRVEFRWLKSTGKKYKNEFGEEFDRTAEGLPEKYYRDSKVTVDIVPGKTVYDFPLSK